MTNSPDNNPQKAVDLRKLLRAINDSFSENDLRDLCFDFQIDFENLPGTVKKDKARELIIHFDRRKRINNLVDAFRKLRPSINIEAIILEAVDEWPSESDPNSLKNEDPLSLNVLSTHAKASAWNQGAPLSPFEFEITLDMVNKGKNTVILRNLEIASFEFPSQLLEQSPPIGELLIVKDNHNRSTATFPYQIPGGYFGLIEYHIKVKLSDLDRLRFTIDSEAFQNYSIELNYEYHDMNRTNYKTSIFVEGSFQEFISEWRRTWNMHLANKGKSSLPNPNDEKRPSRWKKFND